MTLLPLQLLPQADFDGPEKVHMMRGAIAVDHPGDCRAEEVDQQAVEPLVCYRLVLESESDRLPGSPRHPAGAGARFRGTIVRHRYVDPRR